MRRSQFLLAGFFLFTITACSNQPEQQATAAFTNLIPKPVEAKRSTGYFQPCDSLFLVTKRC